PQRRSRPAVALVRARLPPPVPPGMSARVRALGAGAVGPAHGDLDRAAASVAGAWPGSPDHEAARDRILAFLAEHPDALDRTCAPGHLTGSALVVDPASERILLLLHAKVRRWLQ